MSNGIFNDSLNAIIEANFANKEFKDFSIVSVRPGPKISAMIDVMTEMNQNKLPLAKLTDLISVELANFVQARKEHADCLHEAAESIQYASFQSPDENSALGILSKQKLIKRIPDPEMVEFTKSLIATYLEPKEDTSPADAVEKTDGDNGETNNSQDQPSVQ